MIRTQIQLTEQQMEALRAAAEREGVSIAEVIRRSLDRTVASAPGLMTRAEIRRRGVALAGRFSSGRNDISARHDDYLEDAYGVAGE